MMDGWIVTAEQRRKHFRSLETRSRLIENSSLNVFVSYVSKACAHFLLFQSDVGEVGFGLSCRSSEHCSRGSVNPGTVLSCHFLSLVCPPCCIS